MKNFTGVYYDFMKELKLRSALRVLKGIKKPLEKETNWQYVTSEHFKYLYYKQQMALWRRNVKNVMRIKNKARGKIV
jgi:hypothetical protein